MLLLLIPILHEDKKYNIFYNNLGIRAVIIYFALCLSVYI